MLRFFSRVQEAGLAAEMYTYLDGVHTLHNGQRPSEFENIGRGVSALANSGALSGRDTWFAACSRCATARGHYQMNPGTGFCEPSSCIQEIAIRPLKEILARFFQDHPIVSHFSGECVLEERAKDAPHLVVFITSPPTVPSGRLGDFPLLSLPQWTACGPRSSSSKMAFLHCTARTMCRKTIRYSTSRR